MTRGVTDIIILSHNRLEHLVATVEALEDNTPEPIRITIVDNASGPESRNWLSANRHRFERVILRAENEHVAAFQHGIDATLSDPYIVTDPDIVVPDMRPSWLARMHDLMDRHPDFGLIGIGLDNANRPAVLDPEVDRSGHRRRRGDRRDRRRHRDADDPARRAPDAVPDRLADLHRRAPRRPARRLGARASAPSTSAGTTTSCIPPTSLPSTSPTPCTARWT